MTKDRGCATSFVQRRGASSQVPQHQVRQQHAHRQRVVTRAQELKRPELKRPDAPGAPEEPKKLFSEAAAAPAAPVAPVQPTIASPSKKVTIEFQRQRAKEMTKYFNALKLQQQVSESRVFGWTPANEINNGRWVMFGFAVGLLTEYATGVDFIQQFGQIITYLGIADLD